MHTQVTVYYPELAELVLVILKSVLCSTIDFMQSCGMFIMVTMVILYNPVHNINNQRQHHTIMITYYITQSM